MTSPESTTRPERRIGTIAASDRKTRGLPGRRWLSALLPDRVLPSRLARPTLAEAIEWFFEDRDLAANTCRAYRQVHRVLVERLGGMTPLDALTPERVRRVLEDEWGDAAPATFNARRTALRSLADYCQERGWLDHDPLEGIERRERAPAGASGGS